MQKKALKYLILHKNYCKTEWWQELKHKSHKETQKSQGNTKVTRKHKSHKETQNSQGNTKVTRKHKTHKETQNSQGNTKLTRKHKSHKETGQSVVTPFLCSPGWLRTPDSCTLGSYVHLNQFSSSIKYIPLLCMCVPVWVYVHHMLAVTCRGQVLRASDWWRGVGNFKRCTSW